MFREFDTVTLLRSVPEYGLSRGDVGAVVHVYRDAYEVEFVRPDGTTQALLMPTDRDVRLASVHDAALPKLQAAKWSDEQRVSLHSCAPCVPSRMWFGAQNTAKQKC